MDPKALFDSQNFTKRQETIKLILNEKYQLGILPDDVREYFQLVMNAHHNNHKETVFHKVWVVKNPAGANHNNFIGNFTRDGINESHKLIGKSHLKATPKRDLNSIKYDSCKQYLRYSVGFQIANLKRILLEHDATCQCCGIIVSNNAHMDHCGEFEFDALATCWLAAQDIDSLELIERVGVPAKLNEERDEDWLQFHWNNAKFQLLCSTCNLIKPKQQFQL